MAGDWIKWTKGLAKRREVVVMSSRLNRDRHEIAGRLMELWEWCDDNIAVSDVPEMSPDVSLVLGDKPFEFVDALLGLPGMAEAMSSPDVRWLEARSGGRVVFPNLARHNGTSAKTRAYEATKKAKQRAKRPDNPEDVTGNVPKMSPKCPRKTGTREEKRREDTSGVPEVNTPTPFFDTEGLNSAIRTLRKSDGDMLTFEEDKLVWQYEFLKRWNKLPGVSKHAESCLSDFEMRMLLERFQERDWNWQEAMAMFPINWPGSLSLVTFLERDKVQQIVGGKYKIPDFANRVTAAKPKKDIFAGLRASEEKARNEESVFESS